MLSPNLSHNSLSLNLNNFLRALSVITISKAEMNTFIKSINLAMFAIFFWNTKFANSLRLKSRIVGGNSAIQSQFPYQASIRYRAGGEHFCGGAIINENYIISAVHCFTSCANAILIYGVIGITNIEDVGIRIEFSHMEFHPDYRTMRTQYDIALLRTKTGLLFSESIQAIALPATNEVEPGTVAVVTGWGYHEVSYR